MLGDDETVRSSLAVKEVLGQLDPEALSKAVQDMCGAGHLRVDASSKTKRYQFQNEIYMLTLPNPAGSFAISDEMRPRVINLDFPALPSGAARAQKLVENGMFAFSQPSITEL